MEKSQGINFIITEDQARIIADANGLDYDELDSIYWKHLFAKHLTASLMNYRRKKDNGR